MSQDNSNHELETDRLIGTKWEDRYEIIALLGEGATSKVYKARHLLLDSIVAIKILKQGESISESQRRRFLKEANLLKTFEHPNIVRLLAFGQTSEGQDYMVLEYVEGHSLADLLKDRQRLGQTEAIALFKAICSGLAYAHDKGILHRDLKPANIMVTGKGEITSRIARLADFGIFKDIEAEEQKLTQAGEFLGSSNYMSPEQCSNKQLDHRSDLYSLGCLFYETLVGKPPMDDTSDLAIMSNQMNRRITDLPANLHISKGLRRLVLRCLEKSPEARPGSAGELLLELERASLESKADTRIKTKVLGVAAILLVVVGLGALFLKQAKEAKDGDEVRKESKAYLVQYRGLKLPQFPRTPAGLEQLGHWIEANSNTRSPDFSKLVLALGQELEIRRELGLPPKSEYGELVEKKIIEKLASGRESEIERYKLQEMLADTYQLNGKGKEAEETLLALLDMKPGGEKLSKVDEAYRISNIYTKLTNFYPKQEYMLRALPSLEADISQHKRRGHSVLCLTLLEKQTGIYVKTGNLEKAKESLSQASAIIEQILTKERDKDLNSKVLLRYLILSNELACQKEAVSLFNPILSAISKNSNSKVEYLLAQLEVSKALKSCGRQAESDRGLEKLISSLKQSYEMNDDMVVVCLEALHILGRDSEIGPKIESYLANREPAADDTYIASLENLLRRTAAYKFDRELLFRRIDQVVNKVGSNEYQQGILACTAAHKLRELGKIKDSIRLYQRATPLLDRPGTDARTLCGLFAGTSLAYLSDGDIKAAESSVESAEKQCLHIEDTDAAALVYSTKALVLRAQHKYAEAIELHKKVIETQKRNRQPILLGTLFELLKDYTECGRADEFAKLLPSYLGTLDEQGLKEGRRQLLEVTRAACLQEGKGEAADELEKLRNQ